MINRRCSTRSLRVTCVRLSTGKRRYFLERRLDMMRGRAGILYRARVGSAIGRVRPTARTGHRHSHPRPRGRAPTRAEDDPVTQWCVLQLVRGIAASQQ